MKDALLWDLKKLRMKYFWPLILAVAELIANLTKRLYLALDKLAVKDLGLFCGGFVPAQPDPPPPPNWPE